MAPKKPREHAPVAAHDVHHGRQHRAPEKEEPTEQPAAAVATAEQAEAAPAAKKSDGLVLPPTIVSRSAVSKCLREIETLNDFFHQAGIRGAAKDIDMPTPSKVLESVAEANGLNLIKPEARDELKTFLTNLKAKAPVVNMSFPSEASDQFLGKLLEWFRAEVHPHTLMQVGLQPELAAGCTLRTSNKFFDFSFRRRFESSREKLITAIEALDTAPERTKLAGANDTVPNASLAAQPTEPAAPAAEAPAAPAPAAEAVATPAPVAEATTQPQAPTKGTAS